MNHQVQLFGNVARSRKKGKKELRGMSETKRRKVLQSNETRPLFQTSHLPNIKQWGQTQTVGIFSVAKHSEIPEDNLPSQDQTPSPFVPMLVTDICKYDHLPQFIHFKTEISDGFEFCICRFGFTLAHFLLKIHKLTHFCEKNRTKKE